MKEYCFLFVEDNGVTKHHITIFSSSFVHAFQQVLDEIDTSFTLVSLDIRNPEPDVVSFISSFGQSVMLIIQ